MCRDGLELQQAWPNRQPAQACRSPTGPARPPTLKRPQRRLIRRITMTTTTVPRPASDTITAGFVTNWTTACLGIVGDPCGIRPFGQGIHG